MSRMITSEKRLLKAEALIQQAYDEPVPGDMGWANFSYIARVKDILRQAFEMIKFIPKMPGASEAQRAQAEEIMLKIKLAEAEILHPTSDQPGG